MIIQIKVIPKSSQDRVIDCEGNVLKVKCRAVPEKGKANDAVVGILAKHFRVPKRNITILRGSKGSLKIVDIKGIKGS